MYRVAVLVSMVVVGVLSQVQYAGTPHFKVDQFGYRLSDPKVMVISRAMVGFNVVEEGDFSPGQTLEVRSFSQGSMGTTAVFTGAPMLWSSGDTCELSGDMGWWFDFSSLSEPGEYVVFDPENNVRSHPFKICDDVYRDILKAAVKTFYFQRMNFEKSPSFAGVWADGASHMQDTAALDLATRLIRRDVSGGGVDAGDQNKYITFMTDVIHSLLLAYEENPTVFTDDFDIPESDNGVPDLLDELVWALTWMVKMQDDDGGVFIKTGSLNHDDPSPPSSDTRQRYYGPKCTSAGLVVASTFAHASVVLRNVLMYADLANELAERAERAWNWVEERRSVSGFDIACDEGPERIQSGNADRSADDQEEQAVTAAVYLYELTSEEKFNTYVKSNYTKSELFGNPDGSWWGPYKISFQDAMLRYTRLQGADASVSNMVLSRKGDNWAFTDYYDVTPMRSLYRAYMPSSAFHWGHTSARGNGGSIVMQNVRYNVNPTARGHYVDRARQMIHWFHGVNALGKVYLTNMSDYGAENSAYEIFHSWFAQGTRWQNALTGDGPAPGLLPGGPNKDYGYKEGDPSRSWFGPHTVNLRPPFGQPPEKCYLDWGKAWNTEGCINNQCQEGSYAITENAIYYQAAYIRLLSYFVAPSSSSSVWHFKSNRTGGVPGQLRYRILGSNLTVSGVHGIKGTLRIHDLRGRLVLAQDLDGASLVQVSLTRVVPGALFLELRSVDGERVSAKVLRHAR